MTGKETSMRLLEFERFLDHPPEKVWRALTMSELLAEWLMPTDFEPVVGADFVMDAGWGRVSGTVLQVERERKLSYTWNGPDLESEVTWTLTPRGMGTILRLEHSKIPAASKQAYHGARAGWPRFLDALESVLVRITQ